jgi:hypothetical protein
MFRRYVVGGGIDIGICIQYMDDKMSQYISREEEALGVHAAVSAVMVQPY